MVVILVFLGEHICHGLCEYVCLNITARVCNSVTCCNLSLQHSAYFRPAPAPQGHKLGVGQLVVEVAGKLECEGEGSLDARKG